MWKVIQFEDPLTSPYYNPPMTERLLGKADWRWEPDLGMHVPGCSHGDGYGHRCGNGPLDDAQIAEGDCGLHG